MRKSSQVIIIIIITDWSLLTDGAGEVGGGRGEGGGEGGGGGDGTAMTGIRDEDDGDTGRRRRGYGTEKRRKRRRRGQRKGLGQLGSGSLLLRIFHHRFLSFIQITRPYISLYLVESFSLSR